MRKTHNKGGYCSTGQWLRDTWLRTAVAYCSEAEGGYRPSLQKYIYQWNMWKEHQRGCPNCMETERGRQPIITARRQNEREKISNRH